MKKLILLRGESNTGKTTTLKMLIAKLLQAPTLKTSVKYCHGRNKGKLTALCTWKSGTALPKGDISIVLNCEGVLVGVCTDGDTIGAVWDHVAFFERNNCGIGVTACHPEHVQRSLPCLVEPWEYHGIVEKQKAQKRCEESENVKTATDLFDEILKEIKSFKGSQV